MHILQRNLWIIMSCLLIAGSCKKDKNPIDNNIRAHDFLSNDDYDKLVIEIQYVNGFEPTAATVDNLKTFLAQRLNKSNGVTVVLNAISSPAKSSLSLEEIKEIEKKSRSQHTSGKTLTAYFLFADVDYASNNGSSKVLGIAYGNTSMVVFEKSVREFSGGIGKPSETTLESTVSLHEFGHILGLTNNGTPMQNNHQDEPNGRHCSNNNCLMYWSVETSDVISNLTGGNIPALDAQCLADLKANGGK
jgi:hypothetical protein